MFIFLLSGVSLTATPIRNFPNEISSAASCPTNQTLRMTTFPLAASFNMLTSTTLSGYIMAAMLQQTVYPYATYPNGTLYWPNSVTDWVTHNSNYTTWSFNVRPGLKWSNGQNVTAQDILNTYSGNYALNASYDLVGAASEVQNSYAYNNSLAVFVLNQSDAHFAERISLMIFENVQPPAAIQKGPGAALFDANVSDGPFYVSQPYVSGSPEVLLSPNQYFNPKPGACQLQVNFVESSSQLSEFLTSGTTDLAGPLDPSSVSAISNNQNIHILDEKGQNIMTLEYNVTSYPYNMTAFRQALVYAINQSQIQQQALAGYALTAYSAQGGLPTNANLYNPNIQNYSFNPQAAISKLASIGITKGSDGYLHYTNGTVVTINLVTDSDQTFDEAAASIAQTDLQNLGMKVNSQVLAGSTITGDFPSNVNDIQHSIILYTSIGGAFFPNAWADSRPGYNVYQLSYGVGNQYWMYPPNIDAQYQSNVSAIDNTSSPAQEDGYLNNIQALAAEYLPTVVLAYPDELWAYNTQHWTNWPSNSSYFYDGDWVNQTMLAALQPVSSTSTSQPTTTSSSSAATSSAATSASSITTSSTTSKSSVAMNWSIVGVVLAVVLIAGAVLIMRKPDSDETLAR